MTNQTFPKDFIPQTEEEHEQMHAEIRRRLDALEVEGRRQTKRMKELGLIPDSYEPYSNKNQTKSRQA